MKEAPKQTHETKTNTKANKHKPSLEQTEQEMLLSSANQAQKVALNAPLS